VERTLQLPSPLPALCDASIRASTSADAVTLVLPHSFDLPLDSSFSPVQVLQSTGSSPTVSDLPVGPVHFLPVPIRLTALSKDPII
jgi:hypothetical protein